MGAKLQPGQFDVQQDQFTLYGNGNLTSVVDDTKASDGKAVRLTANHTEWAVQLHLDSVPQIKGAGPRLFMIYSAGNFIECTPDAPFLQIGEHKYGKPILDRAVNYDTDLYDALKIGLISMDSTIKSNLGVGLPIDIAVTRSGALEYETKHRIDSTDVYFRDLRERWSAALRSAHMGIPRPQYGGD